MKQFIYKILFVSCVINATYVIGQILPDTFMPRGMGGGGALFFPTINPINEDEYYVSCDMSEMFHTSNFGKSYTQIHHKTLQVFSNSTYEFTYNDQIAYSNHNDGNNGWTSTTGNIEKDVNLNAYLGTFSNQYSPLKVVFAKKRGVVIVEMADYPEFPVEFVGDNTFKTKEVDIKFKFNESKNEFDLMMPEGQKIPFKRAK